MSRYHAGDSGLVSWWTGDGVAIDSALRNSGNLINGSTYAAGKVGQAFRFDGIDDYVQIGARANLRFTNAFSVEGWVNADKRVTGVTQILFNKEGEYQFGIMVSGELWYAIANTNPGWDTIFTNIPFPPGQ